MAKPYKRRILVINKPFQIRFCLYSCSWILGLSLFYPFILYYVFDFLLRYMAVDPTGPQLTDIEEARTRFIGLLIFAQVLILGLSFAMNLLLSHRIAGPLHKLRMTFDRIRAGEKPEPIYFRKFDHFQELAHSFNAMMQSMGRIEAPAASGSTSAASTALPRLELELQNEQNPTRREKLARAISALKDVT